MNALDNKMFRAIEEAGEALKADKSVRAVVLSGNGRAFCAGLDFGSFTRMAESETTSVNDQGSDDAGSQNSNSSASADSVADGDLLGTSDRITHLGQQVAYCWMEIPAPVICAVTGVALGGGFQIAMGADIRIVAPDARMSVLEIRWGLIPDMTGTQTLVRHVGLDVAKELTFTGRMVEGPECVELGLATRVSDSPLDDALTLASDIAAKNPHAIRAAKRLLSNAGSLDLAAGFGAEREEIAKLIGSPNQVESIKAYFDKREPNFTDPD